MEIKEITQNSQYTSDQNNKSEFKLDGSSLVFIGNQIPSELSNEK